LLDQESAPTFALLVVTCDKYSDLWNLFVGQFRRYWPDCALPKYILTNETTAQFDGFTNLRIGGDVSWSDNLSCALDLIPEDYVLLFLDDLVLKGPVNTALLSEALAWARSVRPDHLRLNATERPDERIDGVIGRIREGAIYRTSTVLTLWRKQALRSLLKPGESAWQFEIDGSTRSDAMPHFYSTYRDCFPVINCVIKGKWRRKAVRELRAQGVVPDLLSRLVMTRREAALFAARSLRSMLFKIVPMRYRRVMRQAMMGR